MAKRGLHWLTFAIPNHEDVWGVDDHAEVAFVFSFLPEDEELALGIRMGALYAFRKRRI